MTQCNGCNPQRLNHSRSAVYMGCDLTWSDVYVHQNSSLHNTASDHETDCDHVHWLSDQQVYISQYSIMMLYIITRSGCTAAVHFYKLQNSCLKFLLKTWKKNVFVAFPFYFSHFSLLLWIHLLMKHRHLYFIGAYVIILCLIGWSMACFQSQDIKC